MQEIPPFHCYSNVPTCFHRFAEIFIMLYTPVLVKVSASKSRPLGGFTYLQLIRSCIELGFESQSYNFNDF